MHSDASLMSVSAFCVMSSMTPCLKRRLRKVAGWSELGPFSTLYMKNDVCVMSVWLKFRVMSENTISHSSARMWQASCVCNLCPSSKPRKTLPKDQVVQGHTSQCREGSRVTLPSMLKKSRAQRAANPVASGQILPALEPCMAQCLQQHKSTQLTC